MSIVTISSALGSSGEAIGRALAEELTYTFADREIILKAAERLGQGVAELERLLEGRPASASASWRRAATTWRPSRR